MLHLPAKFLFPPYSVPTVLLGEAGHSAKKWHRAKLVFPPYALPSAATNKLGKEHPICAVNKFSFVRVLRQLSPTDTLGKHEAKLAVTWAYLSGDPL